jgi:hypothetical protein
MEEVFGKRRARAQRLRDLAEKHHRDCITLPEASA